MGTKHKLGAYARAKKLTAQRRSEIASIAALVRWARAWHLSSRKVMRRRMFDPSSIRQIIGK